MNRMDVVTMAPRASVSEINQVFASAGGLAAIMTPWPILAGDPHEKRLPIAGPLSPGRIVVGGGLGLAHGVEP